MEGLELIRWVKRTYNFKEGYNLLIGYSEGREYYGFAFKTISVVSGKKVETKSDIMDGSIYTKDKKEYKEFIETYCNKV